ncbi:hypothetical protein FVER53590_26007 [Fusarium verticillioides]|nr:hypothetical protein FVER53590_26007 [Fusarium verticillioides]
MARVILYKNPGLAFYRKLPVHRHLPPFEPRLRKACGHKRIMLAIAHQQRNRPGKLISSLPVTFSHQLREGPWPSSPLLLTHDSLQLIIRYLIKLVLVNPKGGCVETESGQEKRG